MSDENEDVMSDEEAPATRPEGMKADRTDLELETIVRRINDGELDLQPDFQRGEIWDAKRRQRLIDTILRGWYVPAIHIVREADLQEAVLDGQQRLATIRDFFGDEFPVNGRTEPRNGNIEALDGLRFSQLPSGVKRTLQRFVLPVVYLRNYSPGEPNELFFRLNQSYNLTPPEKRNALHGEARNQVRTLVEEFHQFGLLDASRIGFSNGRLAYDDIVARSCVAIEMGTLRRHINNNVVEEFYRGEAFSPDTLDGLRDAASVLAQQIDAAGGRVKFNKGTLQTWFIYSFWATRETGRPPLLLLRAFEEARALAKKGQVQQFDRDERRFLSVVSLYDDRASYRVTDVTSVLARDIAIHLFSVDRFATPGRRGSKLLVERIKASDEAPAEQQIFEFADRVAWGEPLVEGSLYA